MENLDLGGGQAFAVEFPTSFSDAIAAVGAVLAVVGLFVSCLSNRQPLFSLPHTAALCFLLPLLVTLIIP